MSLVCTGGMRVLDMVHRICDIGGQPASRAEQMLLKYPCPFSSVSPGHLALAHLVVLNVSAVAPA